MIKKCLKYCFDITIKNLFIVSGLMFTIAILLISGIYWGWVDDVFYANNYQCLTNSLPLYDPDYFIGLSSIIIYLYKHFSSISWLGYFLFSLLSVVYILNLITINSLIRKHNLSNKITLLFSFLLSGIFHYYFFRLNFTSISCLAVATGLVYTELSSKNRDKFIGFSLSIIGLLIRWQTAFIIYLLYLIYIVIIFFESRKRFSKVKPSLIYIPITFILFFAIKLNIKNSDVINLYKTTPFEFLIQDAYFISESKNISYNESLIRDAIKYWNTQDGEIINRDWYLNMLKNSTTSWSQIVEIFEKKLVYSLKSSVKYENQQKSMNWNFKLLFYLIPLITALYISIKSKPINYKYYPIFLLLSFLLISAIAIIVKIEDRILFPYLFFIYFLSIIYFNGNEEQAYKLSFNNNLFKMYFLAFSIFLFVNTYNQSKILKEDLDNKSKFIEEVNSFEGKIFLLDGFSPYLFQTSPFKNVTLNKKNSYLLTLHYGRNNFSSIQNSFPGCHNLSYIETFKCIESHKDNVIFIYADHNIDFMKKWNSNFYNLNSNFKKINTHSILANLKNKFIFGDVGMNYYILE